jgi:hypothetical protein
MSMQVSKPKASPRIFKKVKLLFFRRLRRAVLTAFLNMDNYFYFRDAIISLKSFHVIPIGKKNFKRTRYFFMYLNIRYLIGFLVG